MAQQKFEKGTELHQMINDYLRLLQQFWIVEESESYWEQLLESIYGFYGKYKEIDNVFAITMTLAFLDVLEEKARNKRGVKGKLFERLESDTNGN